jgi:hypothetical protein
MKLSVKVQQSSFRTIRSEEAITAQLSSESAKHAYHTDICYVEIQLSFTHIVMHLVEFPAFWSNASITTNSGMCTISKAHCTIFLPVAEVTF